MLVNEWELGTASLKLTDMHIYIYTIYTYTQTCALVSSKQARLVSLKCFRQLCILCMPNSGSYEYLGMYVYMHVLDHTHTHHVPELNPALLTVLSPALNTLPSPQAATPLPLRGRVSMFAASSYIILRRSKQGGE